MNNLYNSFRFNKKNLIRNRNGILGLVLIVSLLFINTSSAFAANNNPSTTQSATASTVTTNIPTLILNQYKNNPKGLLPIFRYQSHKLNVTPTGGFLGGIITATSSLPTQIGFYFFQIANLIWEFTAFLIDLSSTSDLTKTMAHTIDSGFQNIASLFGAGTSNPTNSLLMLGVVFTFLLIIRKVIAGDVTNVWRVAITFIVPIVFMFSLSNAIDANVGTTNDKSCPQLGLNANTGANSNTLNVNTTTCPYTPKVFSPSWLGITGTHAIDSIAGYVATAPSFIHMLSAGANNTTTPGEVNCANYNAELYNLYNAIEAQNGDKKTLVGSAGFLPEQVSMIYQAAYERLFTAANFGSAGEGGANAVCHYLEWDNNISPPEQYLISQQAYGTASANSIPPSAFYNNENNGNTVGYSFFPWMACPNYSAQDKSNRTAWLMLDSENGGSNPCSDSVIFDKTNAFSTSSLNFKDPVSVTNAYNCALNQFSSSIADAVSQAGGFDTSVCTSGYRVAGTTTYQDLTNAEATILSFRGGASSGNRIALGFGAVAAAFAMLWTLGVLAVGSLAAQIGLVILLIWLPVTLFILALPKSKNFGSTNSLGTKMLKYTIAFTTSKLILMLAMVLITQLTVIIINVLGG